MITANALETSQDALPREAPGNTAEGPGFVLRSPAIQERRVVGEKPIDPTRPLEIGPIDAGLFRNTAATPSVSRFRALQRWRGFVTSVEADSFIARLEDLTVRGRADEEVELYLEDVSEDERELVCPGAWFYWSIGYHDSASGQRLRSSLIRFARIPRWNQAEISAGLRAAEELRKKLGW